MITQTEKSVCVTLLTTTEHPADVCRLSAFYVDDELLLALEICAKIQERLMTALRRHGVDNSKEGEVH